MNIASRSSRLTTHRLDLAAGRIDLTHGAGGRAMQQLITEIFHSAFDNPILKRGDDHAAFAVAAGRMVMSTDSSSSRRCSFRAAISVRSPSTAPSTTSP